MLVDGIDDDDAEDLALIENDERDDEDSKAFIVELRKMASTLNGGDSGDSLGPLCRTRIFGG
jgi:hypothetical protein